MHILSDYPSKKNITKMESVSKLKLFNSIGEHKHKVQWMFLEPHTRIQVSQLTFKLKIPLFSLATTISQFITNNNKPFQFITNRSEKQIDSILHWKCKKKLIEFLWFKLLNNEYSQNDTVIIWKILLLLPPSLSFRKHHCSCHILFLLFQAVTVQAAIKGAPFPHHNLLGLHLFMCFGFIACPE